MERLNNSPIAPSDKTVRKKHSTLVEPCAAIVEGLNPKLQPRSSTSSHLCTQCDHPTGFNRFDSPPINMIIHMQFIFIFASPGEPVSAQGLIHQPPNFPVHRRRIPPVLPADRFNHLPHTTYR